MQRLSFGEYFNAVAGKTIEDVAEEIKTLPFYSSYKKDVLAGDTEETNKLLEIASLIHGKTDAKFDAMIKFVSIQFMFAMIDMRLRAEILEESEGENE